VTTFCTAAPNTRIGGSSAWNLSYVTILGARIWRGFIDFWKICVSLLYDMHGEIFTFTEFEISVKVAQASVFMSVTWCQRVFMSVTWCQRVFMSVTWCQPVFIVNLSNLIWSIPLCYIKCYSKSVYKHNNFLGIRILFDVQGYKFRLIIKAIFRPVGYRLKYIKRAY
jgi:hypothetical protein